MSRNVHDWLRVRLEKWAQAAEGSLAQSRSTGSHGGSTSLPPKTADLRHSFGTLGASIWPLHDLQAYMGHAQIETTMIYTHHTPKIAAADEMSRAVAEAMSVGSAAVVEGARAG